MRASRCGPSPFAVLSEQEKDLAGKAAFGTFLFATGVMLAVSGFALIRFAPFLFLLGFPLIILGGIVWIRAKCKARRLKGGSNL